jgi:hypothetical protein
MILAKLFVPQNHLMSRLEWLAYDMHVSMCRRVDTEPEEASLAYPRKCAAARGRQARLSPHLGILDIKFLIELGEPISLMIR